MTWDHPVAVAWLARRGPHVRARILRLNPNGPVTGVLLRGWRRKMTMRDHFLAGGGLSRGAFIEDFGRHTWERISAQRPDALRWDGRRCWVSRMFVERWRDALADYRDGRIAAFPGPATRVYRKHSIDRQTWIAP